MESMQEQLQLNKANINQDKSVKSIIQYFTFFLGKERYGIPVEHVKEVIEYHQVYRIPLVPSYIRGIINVRGEILPVIDLSYLFYGRISEITVSTGIIFIECALGKEIIVVGGIIDAVESVTDVQEENIESTPAFGENIRPDYIRGVGKVGKSFIILLDISHVLNIEELSQFKAKKIAH